MLISAGSSRPNRVPARGQESTHGRDHAAEFWRSYIAAGLLIIGLESLVIVDYASLTHAPNRIAIELIALSVGILSLVGAAFGRAISQRSWRAQFCLATYMVVVVILAVCAHLDTGLNSPLLYLLPLPVLFVAVALGPQAVALCSGTSVAAGAAVAITDPHVTHAGNSTVLLAGLILGASVLAVTIARIRHRLQQSERVLLSELDYQARVDALTGCWNHATFYERLDKEVERAIRYDRPLSLAIADVDLFKAFNDTYGHAAGDQALAHIGSVLRAARSTDFVGRVGGDEFAILMPETLAEDAWDVVARLVAEVEDGSDPKVGISVGIGVLDAANRTTRQLFQMADQSMYRSKGSRRRTPADESGADPVAQPTADHAAQVVVEAELRRTSDLVSQTQRELGETTAVLDALLRNAAFGFAFIDRDYRVVQVNAALAAATGIPVERLLGHRVQRVVPHLWPLLKGPLELALADGVRSSGLEVLSRTAPDPDREHVWLATIDPIWVDGHIIGVGIVTLDVTDRLTAERNHEARTVAVVSALARSVDSRHPYTGSHQHRVAEIATAIAVELGYDEFTTQGIRLAATVHDVGTLAVPAEILSKPTSLTAGEMAVVQSHSLVGYDILQDITSPWPIADMVVQHHERLDGSGYPHGLRGDEICLGARIIAVADVVEAMSAHRPYRSAPGLEVALSFVLEGRGTAFAADVVDACVVLGETGRLPGFDDPGLSEATPPTELPPILEAL